jgi:hypothetical protein
VAPTDVFLVTATVTVAAGLGPLVAWERRERGPFRPVDLARAIVEVTRWALARYARGWAETDLREVGERVATILAGPVVVVHATTHLVAYATALPSDEPVLDDRWALSTRPVRTADAVSRLLASVAEALLFGTLGLWYGPTMATSGGFAAAAWTLLLLVQGVTLVLLAVGSAADAVVELLSGLTTDNTWLA